MGGRRFTFHVVPGPWLGYVAEMPRDHDHFTRCGPMRRSLVRRGARLARWNLRDIALILGSAVFFALTIRGYQIFGISIPALGLVVSGPITMIICGLAARDLRFSQLVVFSLAMTVVCTILFRFLLGLPIPVAPWALGY